MKRVLSFDFFNLYMKILNELLIYIYWKFVSIQTSNAASFHAPFLYFKTVNQVLAICYKINIRMKNHSHLALKKPSTKLAYHAHIPGYKTPCQRDVHVICLCLCVFVCFGKMYTKVYSGDIVSKTMPTMSQIAKILARRHIY